MSNVDAEKCNMSSLLTWNMSSLIRTPRICIYVMLPGFRKEDIEVYTNGRIVRDRS